MTSEGRRIPAITTLDRWQRAAYAVSCAGRYIVVAKDLDKTPSKVFCETMTSAASLLWQAVDSREAARILESVKASLLLLQDTQPEDLSAISADLLQRLASILTFAIEAVEGTPDGATLAGREAYDFQDVIAAVLLGVERYDEQAEELVVHSEYVQFEIAAQRRDVELLQSGTPWRTTVSRLRDYGVEDSVTAALLLEPASRG
jgi:hypothetical protein